MACKQFWFSLMLLVVAFSCVYCRMHPKGDDDKSLRFENIHTEHGLEPPSFERTPDSKRGYGLTQPSGNDIIRVPWWPTFLMMLINYFYHQRPPNRSQFGVLFMGNIDNLNQFPATFQPHNSDGTPVINNANPISPSSSSSYGNYLASRPENVQHTMIHAENLILNQMNNLWNAYFQQNNRHPNFIVLYSWIMPCPDCTNLIINRFNQNPYRGVEYRVISYTVEGINSLPYMTPAGNAHSRQQLQNNSLTVYRHRCDRPGEYDPGSDPEGDPEDPAVEMTDQEFDDYLGTDGDITIDPDTHTCKLSDTLQGCMLYCLDNDLSCSCKDSKKLSMNAAMINDLSKKCATKRILECSRTWIASWMNADHSGASTCSPQDKVEHELARCINQCEGRPLSKPLNPDKPYFYEGYLTNFADLSRYPTPDFTSFCSDIRAEGLLCTTFRSDSFTAGNTLCRHNDRCGYKGYKYSWCYVDFSNNWDYCCTGACGFAEGTNYMWCRSGNKWQYCGNAGDTDIQGRKCLSHFPCGMHQEDSKMTYYWCYVDMNNNWDRCCEPWDRCSRKGSSYTWCYTGLQRRTWWYKCEK